MTSFWEIVGDDVDAQHSVGALAPVHVLVDVDGPRLFVARGAFGGDLLVYQAAEDEGRLGWLVVPTDERTIVRLRNGATALRDALDQPWAWAVIQGYEGALRGVRRVGIADVPSNLLPAEGVTLVARASPLLSVRALGPTLTAAEVPASVVRKVIDGAMHAMKALIEHALEVAPSDGRPSERLRRYYDLPTQRLAFGSFEATFGEPVVAGDAPLLLGERHALDRAARLLRRGIATVQGAPLEGDGDASDPELDVALDALSGLLPPGSGAIEEMQLGGQLVGLATVRLSREHGARARRYLRRTRRAVEPVLVRGTIRELDKDAMTFIVRSDDLSQSWPCRFSSAHRDDVFTAFAEDTPVAVSGHRHKGKAVIEVLAIEGVG
jgi:hypothetical protein